MRICHIPKLTLVMLTLLACRCRGPKPARLAWGLLRAGAGRPRTGSPVVAAIPHGRHRSLVGALIEAAPGVRRVAAKALPFVREHVVSVAAFAAVDYGAFGLSRYAGGIGLGVSAVGFDWLVRGRRDR